MRGRQIRAALVLVLANFRMLFYLAGGLILVLLGAVPGAAALFTAEPSQMVQALGLLPYTTAHGRELADVVGRVVLVVIGGTCALTVLTLSVLDVVEDLRPIASDDGKSRAC